jgi:stage II sporulation protein AA (anti-sigma F factor antagonist)
MKIVMTTIQKTRLDAVSEALMDIGVKNITASEVTSLNDEGVFATMTKVEAVVDDNQADAAVNAIAQASLSGDSGPIQIVGCEQQQRQEPQKAEAPAPTPAPEPVSVTIGGSSSLTTERSGQTLIVSAKGRIDGANATEVQGVLSSAIEPGVKLMLLDLGGLTYISSAGLRVIMLTARTLDRNGAKFAVGSPAGPIREVFQISGFDQIIPIFDSRAEAIESLGS